MDRAHAKSKACRTAIIIGASSGIGEAVARRLAAEGWRLGLASRRLERLDALAREIGGGGALVRYMDLAEPDGAASALEQMIDDLGGADLVIVSAGWGRFNSQLDWTIDRKTLEVNVLGFAAVAQAAVRSFRERGRGHLVGLSSIAALRGDGATTAYAASKSFVSCYLDGLRDLVKDMKGTVVITEIQPGFVDTPMIKGNKGAFWIASPEEAAKQILAAVNRRAKHAYVTRRWGLIALLLKIMPRPG